MQQGCPRAALPSPMGFWQGCELPGITCGLSPSYEFPEDTTSVPASPTSSGCGERLVTRMPHREAGSAKVSGEHRR